MKVFAIAGTNVRRMLADRGNIFFVFIMPLALVLLIGAQFGGDFRPQLGVVAGSPGPLGDQLIEALGDRGVGLTRYGSEREMVEAVSRAEVHAAVVIPDGFDAGLRAGEPVEIAFFSQAVGSGPQLRSIVESALAEQAWTTESARIVAGSSPVTYDSALRLTGDLQESIPGVRVRQEAAGEALFPESLGRFDLGASNQLVLFMFLTTLAGSAALIQSRQLGVSSRMLSTPTGMATVVAGEAVGRFAVALVQGLYIMAATLVVFGVNWGNPAGAIALVVMFALVGAGAATLMGATFRNDQQAGGMGVVVGLVLAALGGAMLPLELFSPTMQRVAHFTPHAWALDGFAELVRRGGSIADVLAELGVLASYAAVLLALAAWRLKKAITAGA